MNPHFQFNININLHNNSGREWEVRRWVFLLFTEDVGVQWEMVFILMRNNYNNAIETNASN